MVVVPHDPTPTHATTMDGTTVDEAVFRIVAIDGFNRSRHGPTQKGKLVHVINPRSNGHARAT